MTQPISDEQISSLSACILRGRKIEAIKLYREMTGLGLKESKDAIEELEQSLRTSSPDKFVAGAQGKGCLSVIIVGLLCGTAFVTYWLA